jgi:hypothetical protein
VRLSLRQAYILNSLAAEEERCKDVWVEGLKPGVYGLTEYFLRHAEIPC